MPILAANSQIEEATAAALSEAELQEGYRLWTPRLRAHVEAVQQATQDEFCTPAFQQMLWESESVAATGQGTINVTKVTTSPQVAQLLWEFKQAPMPQDRALRVLQLREMWDRLTAAVAPMVRRNPRLKMYRVFAALFPQDFTTIAHATKLRKLARAMGIGETSSKHPIALHGDVLHKLEEALGPVPAPPLDAGIQRMTLPWLLFASRVQERSEEVTTVQDPQSISERLNPLPAARRRKGLLAIAGFLTSIRNMIEFAKEGCTREDMREHIRTVNPKLATSSINTNINALIAEWGVLKATGTDLHLTIRGESFLETGEPAELSDWLLTRILGFDNVLFALRAGPAAAEVLKAALQQVNPGWTTTFAPGVLVNWTVHLGLVAANAHGLLQLTDEGLEWAARIHWTPESLTKDESDVSSGSDAKPIRARDEASLSRPSLDEIYNALPAGASFSKALIARLDAGLWHNERRHFAVLTGLSGAGKTLLARSYGLALWREREDPSHGLLVLPVQPGWHDPSALLGYASPLVENLYVRTTFLDFLLRAAGHPDLPFTVVLDEMNLSHPEQYLAPLLSSMETGDSIEFHTSDEELTGVPPRIAYPSNLVVIGTVNMDETTHGLSDKVLDRTCVIDFWKVDISAYPGWANSGLSVSETRVVRDLLIALGAALEPVRLHFGWRTVSDVIGYMRSALQGGTLNMTEALDHAVYGKVLTKFRGEDTTRLRIAFESAWKALTEAELSQSASKVAEMLEDLRQTGSARFWR